MASIVTIDLRQVARGLDFPLRQVQAVVELLDEGNTVPFITRYRKDQTGGLDEEQIREIQDRLARMRLLAERKQTILRSIDAQGKLTEKLAKQILSATTTKRLEDLYLPFKPKKQTLATLARSRGLEGLATEILEASPSCNDLDARARDFANPDRQVATAAEALLGAGHILAETFSERADLRQRLREILQKSGRVVTTQIVVETPAEHAPSEVPPEAAQTKISPSEGASPEEAKPENAIATDALPETVSTVAAATIAAVVDENAVDEKVVDENVSEKAIESPAVEPVAEAIAAEGAPAADGETIATASSEAKPQTAPVATASARRARDRERAKAEKQHKKDLKKRKADERRIKAFRDYFDYSEDIKKIPPHRVLAVNRAERAKVLRVKIDCHVEAMHGALDEILVPPEHPHADYLRGCARDALARLILPALEREARRELTDRAESHAVGVFARNLRNLLLQPPIHNRRVLAVDPGFKSGCKLAAVDQFGNVLGQDVIFLIGKAGHTEEAKRKCTELIQNFELTVVAIGNGTACREAEDFFAELISNDLKEKGVAYVIVNEAGASVYSTSQLGREEFPEYDATLRGAVSIGRRLLDPLSELVKIEPASIGVGLYQHDVKAKHLEVSLDEVVASCVNYVGVDVNTASPALLRYVSGLNQLTARRVFEYRREHGPFRNREQLREVPGFGEATFVQAAGFLKITGGDNPLDSTWIHPESYVIARKVLGLFEGKPSDLTEKESAAALAQKMTCVDLPELSKELFGHLPQQQMSLLDFADPAEAASGEAASGDAMPIPQVASPTAETPATADTPATAGVHSAPLEAAPKVPKETAVGVLTLSDILAQLVRPGRDPREDLPLPVFKQGVLKLEDLAAGMELTGTILNVVDFGCFVDIGMHDSGLVHVSRLADRFIRDPHEVVAVGDIVKVWVMEVDKERRRVSLTMVQPGSERSRRTARGEGEQGQQGDGQSGQPTDRPPRSGNNRQGQQRGRDQQGGRPQGRRPEGATGQTGQVGTPQDGQPQSGSQQGGGSRGGRPQQGRRPQHAGGQQQGGGSGSSQSGRGRDDRRDDRRGSSGPPRRPYPQGPGQSRATEYKPKPKPAAPITDEMKKGKAPMRTFGDLMQFFETKDETKKPPSTGRDTQKPKITDDAPPDGSAKKLEPPTTTDNALPS